jgi:hypothetical protein
MASELCNLAIRRTERTLLQTKDDDAEEADKIAEKASKEKANLLSNFARNKEKANVD